MKKEDGRAGGRLDILEGVDEVLKFNCTLLSSLYARARL